MKLLDIEKFANAILVTNDWILRDIQIFAEIHNLRMIGKDLMGLTEFQT